MKEEKFIYIYMYFVGALLFIIYTNSAVEIRNGINGIILWVDSKSNSAIAALMILD